MSDGTRVARSLAYTGAAVAIAVAGYLMLGGVRRAAEARIVVSADCVTRYRRARTLADTLIVDRVVTRRGRTASLTMSCGVARRLAAERRGP